MDHAAYLDQIRLHRAALHAAAEEAGPDAPVPTCPGWTVRDLVTHVAGLQAWVELALPLPPDGPAPEPPRPPQGWADLLAWWAERAEGVTSGLAGTDPATRTWSFIPGFSPTAGWFARRQAHELAIHRIDAEHAAHGDVPTLLFDPAFAADGIAELLDLVVLVPSGPAGRDGTVLLHAADAGRAWLVALSATEPTRVDPSPGEPDALDADAKVVGTADAVYRAVWGRPGHAVVSGDSALVTTIKSF
ncbi:maleylpyruvate isomerase N-terminal domain-containing protein [Actinokineospora sp. NPDC004072]